MCGVEGRVSARLPLEGENDDERENDEPKREHSRRAGRRSYGCKGCVRHRRSSVPTRVGLVKLHFLKRLQKVLLYARCVTIFLKVMPRPAIALLLILPR